MAATQSQPAYLDIARRKWENLNSSIPPEWRLPDEYIPHGMRLSPIDSIHRIGEYAKDKTNLLEIPGICGLLSEKELGITEQWDVRGLLGEISSERLRSEEVVYAFCKVNFGSTSF
jgi:hypothetical protein